MAKHTQEVLNAIAAGEMTRAQAAIELECSPRHVNRLMEAAGVRRPPGASRVARAAARARKESRQARILGEAVKVDLVGVDVSTAAARAGCSERTIYRYRKKK